MKLFQLNLFSLLLGFVSEGFSDKIKMIMNKHVLC